MNEEKIGRLTEAIGLAVILAYWGMIYGFGVLT